MMTGHTLFKAIADRAIAYALVLLIVSTVIVRLTAELPASSEAIASLVVQARSNPDAARLVADALADDPSPSKSKLLDLKRKVLAAERAGATHAGGMQPDNALALEAQRLSSISFWDMTTGDQLRWGVLMAGRAIPVLLAGLIAWCGWRVWRCRSPRRRSAS